MTTPDPLHGFVAPAFSELAEVLARNVASDAELGASLCVIVDDETVVDVWGGFADEARTRPWGQDTITNLWSISKTAAALAALTLVDRGLLELDAPVARYWPEFAAGGKERIRVCDVLQHSSGVVGWDPPMTAEGILDVPASAAALAAQEPWFRVDDGPGYALICFGHLIDALVRRVDGRPLGQFVAEELSDPLGADFWLGLPASEEDRVSLVVPPPAVRIDPERRAAAGSIAARAYTGPNVGAKRSWSRAWREAGIGGAGGTGNARSTARLNQVIAQNGMVDGQRMLSASVVDAIFAAPRVGDDLVLQLPLRWGLGWALPDPVSTPWLPAGHTAFWGGWGGSLVICDTERRMTFAYVMNRMSATVIGSERSIPLVEAVYRALG